LICSVTRYLRRFILAASFLLLFASLPAAEPMHLGEGEDEGRII